MVLKEFEHKSFLDKLKSLRLKLNDVPMLSGVYLHKNNRSEILYVGKAKNLRARLRSYFVSPDQLTPKTKALVEKIDHFDIIITQNEYESLILENNLIKKHKPPYNVLLRDDKTYPYLKIDIQEPWPRVTLVRRKKKDGALYFGPYTLAGQVFQITNVINRFFPLVKCAPHVFKTVKRPCTYYEIKRCLGPCALDVDTKIYQEHVSRVIELLKGKQKDLKQNMMEKIQHHASLLEFEKAAILRDQMKALETLKESQSAYSFDKPWDLDVVCYFGDQDQIVFYVAHVRNGLLVGGSSLYTKIMFDEYKEVAFSFEELEDQSSNTALDLQGLFLNDLILKFFTQYYENKEMPEHIYFENYQNALKENSLNDLRRYFRNVNIDVNTCFWIHRHELMAYLSNQDVFKKMSFKTNLNKLVEHALANAKNKYLEMIKVEEKSASMLSDLKNLIGLTFVPRRIECFDISTFQGSSTVASQVVFVDGAPCKSLYRKYIIQSVVDKTDDFASLREVMRRRFKDKENLPDVLLIDGGTPQIREVCWVLKSLGLDSLFVMGIAKSRIKSNFTSKEILSTQERLVIPKRNSNGEILPQESPFVVALEQGSLAFQLVTQLRDEAHRFAISFHRKKRNQKAME